MQKMVKSISIPLGKPLTDASGKISWEKIDLREPALIEMNQFYEEQKKSGALSAVGLLISLLAGIPVSVIKGLSFTRFKQCEVFLLTFLNYKPDEPDADGVPIDFTSIPLSSQLEDSTGKQAWESIDLREPTLDQVEQFYKTQTVKGGLIAMSSLISDLSLVPLPVINRLPYTDYKRCEGYLLGFLNYSPTAGDGGI